MKWAAECGHLTSAEGSPTIGVMAVRVMLAVLLIVANTGAVWPRAMAAAPVAACCVSECCCGDGCGCVLRPAPDEPAPALPFVPVAPRVDLVVTAIESPTPTIDGACFALRADRVVNDLRAWLPLGVRPQSVLCLWTT